MKGIGGFLALAYAGSRGFNVDLAYRESAAEARLGLGLGR